MEPRILMKMRILIALVFIICAGTGFGQGLNSRFVMVTEFLSSTVLNDSTFRTNVSFPSSQIGAFIPSMIQAGDEAVDGNGRRYRVHNIVSTLTFSATIDFVEMQNLNLRPQLVGVIYEPGMKDIIPLGPTGTFGITAALQARIINHMQALIDTIATGSQTLSISGDTLSIEGGNSVILPSGFGGEANTASNLGAGTGVFASKSGVDLRFKSIVTTGNTTVSSNSTTITIGALYYYYKDDAAAATAGVPIGQLYKVDTGNPYGLSWGTLKTRNE